MGNGGPKRSRADYKRFYDAQCEKLARRTLDYEHHAYESTLALLRHDYPEKSEVDCVIALAKMALYAPLVGPRA